MVAETKAWSQTAYFYQLIRRWSALIFEPWFPPPILTPLLRATFIISNMS